MDYLSVFVEMLQARNLTANTVRSYQTYIKTYLAYLQAQELSPENVSWSTVRSFLRNLQAERSLSDRTINMVISQLQFFWVYVLHKPWDETQVPFRKFNTYLPFVPDRAQVARFLDSLDKPKEHLACSILYATGIRLDELCHLKCANISLSRKKLYIPTSKNHSDRYIPIPNSICIDILQYWYSCPPELRPRTWFFTQQTNIEKPMDKQWLQRIIIRKKEALHMDERFCAHSLRHAYATHSYENGMDLLTLKAYLGHHSINSTAIYVHLTDTYRDGVINPFDQLGNANT
jgi:site-specific recombinase XerD